MSQAITIQGLSKVFTQRGQPPRRAVDDLSLVVPAGQVIGLLGHNGAGKTTTIKMVCGLVTPTAGRVTLHGHDVARARGSALRHLGAVLEGTRNVYWRLSPWQNLLYFGRLKGVTGGLLTARAERLLTELGLWARRHDPVRAFSRGMQQQVAIACALIADPPIVLLDEPTLGLDVRAARLVSAWIARLARREGKTVVLTTHQLDLAQALCDRVAIMRGGRLVADRPLADLLALVRDERYRLRLAGRLDPLPPALAGLTATLEDDQTILHGVVADQAALERLLDAARASGRPLLELARLEPTLEDVFLRLATTEEGGR